jgi:cell division control protein 6
MAQKGLNGFFEKFLEKKSLFRNKQVLQPNYSPDMVLHRDEQINQIASMLAPCLRNEKPSNLFIYGKTGTGKTLSIVYTTNHIKELAIQRSLPIKVIYLNCKLKKVADTEYRLIAHLAREFGKAIPPTGLPTDEVYNIFFSALENEGKIIILILDEIDQLMGKSGNEILYNLTRVNSELKKTQLSIIGISNDIVFTETLDPRVKSSLSEEELIFPPYNAIQIQEILSQRVKQAFFEGTIEEGVVQKCAAYSAREHGDARRAIELLRVAGELAERDGSKTISMVYIDQAENKIEKDRVVDIVKTQPKQFQATIYSIISVCSNNKNTIFTGEVYEFYKRLCEKISLSPLTQRRISDIIAELDMLGIINAKVISKGRYGRTREINISIPQSTIQQIRQTLEEGLVLS